MRWPLRRTLSLPTAVTAALDGAPGDQVIAWATEQSTGTMVVATTWQLAAVSADGEVLVQQPWHCVDVGHWDADTWTLSVTWTDGTRPRQWTLGQHPGRMPEVFRERVEATIVVAEPLGLTGPRRSGRVVLRKDLQTQELFVQPVLGRGTPAGDPEVRRAVEWASERLREQAGL